MRNLKKFLALVLAMVMAFSLMLTANAANTAKDFEDAANITEEFVEAADVLTGMKVFQGDEGGFRPGDTINRAEVAALIYRLATGDVDDIRSGAYANYGGFTDVTESDWFAGYVGYCANAGYIKGTSPTTFEPYAPVTGYETLAMILRAIGYDKNNEFTGPTWETNVSALATQLGILTNIKTTHYGSTLYLASRRDVVAELLFQADAFVPMVIYTPAFGYQPYGVSGGVVGSVLNPTLGKHIFGLALSDDGILLGNQQTGEDGSVMGYAGSAQYLVTPAGGGSSAVYDTVDYSAYAWAGTKVDPTTINPNAGAANNGEVAIGNNIKYELETGIDLIGHKLKLWYDDGSGVVSNSKKHVYAYFDKATLTDVVTVCGVEEGGTITMPDSVTNVTATASNYSDGGRNLYDQAKEAGFKVNSSTEAVFNNSFGKFGSDFTDADEVGNGVYAVSADAIASPVNLYKLISNSDDKSLDAVISLNIESSQITESNNVNRVPTIGLPVMDNGDVDVGDDVPTTSQLETMFITAGTGGGLGTEGVGGTDATTDAGENVKEVPASDGVLTGVIAQEALVGNSTKTLGDYEFGVHITGTSPRNVSDTEQQAINQSANKDDMETAYFLLSKVTAPVEGTVVAYNVNAGTVTLDNGTVLNRSKYYHTVVGWCDLTPESQAAPSTAIPQGWVQGADYWIEGYANVAYKFYLDFEGNYLGAERTYGATFLYGTYMDYSQATSTSTFNYYLTGVTMDGKIDTIQVKKYWRADDATSAIIGPASTTTETTITGTNDLGIPFRDTYGAAIGQVNGIGTGRYIGFSIMGETVDPIVNDPYDNRNEYLSNMARLGIHNGAYEIDGDAEVSFVSPINITNTDTTLGAIETDTDSNKYFTEATKFILVSGFGTDSVKAEVFEGISALKGTYSMVTLAMDETAGNLKMSNIDPDAVINEMTYYTESPYTYAQSGDTAMKIDTIILPKAAVTWSGGSGLYYVGDPNYNLINSWGTDAWRYTLYQDGEAQQVWLTNDPSNDTPPTSGSPDASDATYNLVNDVFVNLKDTGKTANDGKPIYTAGMYDPEDGKWQAGIYYNNVDATWSTSTDVYGDDHRPQLGYMAGVTYTAVTRDAQTATFSGDGTPILERVAGAKVVNLNASNSPRIGSTSGYIWPGITNLTTLNEAGSIDPVTGRALKVSAVVDPSNPLIVTCIYVCWDQNP